MRLVLSRFVAGDLEEISKYIERDNPERAESFLQEFYEQFRLIAARPGLFRIRTEYGPAVRFAHHGRYLIVFRILGATVQIDRILHGSRELSRLRASWT